MAGNAPSERATRTCSRAVPEAIWHFHDSQAAQDGISQSAQPLRASKSATSSRNWQVAAVRCPASSQIRASSRSIGSSDGPDVVATLMYSILWNGYDIPPNARFRGNAHPRTWTLRRQAGVMVQMIRLGVPAWRQLGGERGVHEPGDGHGVRGWGSTAR